MPTVSKTLSANYRLDLNIDVLSQNTANNTTDFRWTLVLVRTSGAWAASTGGSWSVNIDGGRASGSVSYDFRNYTSLTLGTGTVTTGHNSDGTKSIYVGGSFSDRLGYIPGGTADGWVALPTIPRKTFPNIGKTGWATGETLVVNLSPASSSFTHELQIHFKGISETVIGRTSATTLNWVIRHDLLAQIPNAANGTLTVRLLTYSGNTYLGYTDNWIAISPGAGQVPSFTDALFTEGNPAVTAASVGRYVQSVSNLAYEVRGAAGIHGSTIAKYEVRVGAEGGPNVVGQSTTNTGTTPPIPASGTVPIRVTVTDTRGKTAYKDYSLTGATAVLAYSMPKITSVAAARTDSTGAFKESGDYARVTLSGSVSSLVVSTQKNRSKYKIETRESGTSGAWTVRVNSTASTSTSVSVNPNYGTFDTAKSFDVRATVEDVFGNKEVRLSTIPIATIFMHWAQNKGMGVGKFWSKGSIDAMEEIYQNNGQAVLSVQAPVVLANESSQATRTVTNGTSWDLTVGTFTVTKPTLVRVWHFGTWDTTGNAAFNMHGRLNGAEIINSVPSQHTQHSLGSSGVQPYYYEYKALLQPGSNTLVTRFGVHSGGLSIRIRNYNYTVEKIGD